MGSSAVKVDWSKFEVDDNGDFVTDPDGNFVEKKVETPAPGVTMMDALFPRRAKAEKEGAGPVRQFAARAADVGSNLLGVPYAAVETVAGPKEKRSKMLGGEGSFKGNLADREGGTLLKRIANDPATVPAAAITGGGSAISQLTAAGIKQGVASALAHQMENVGEGKKIDPKAAAVETTLNALLPGVVKKGGQALKAAGKGFMQSILKPSKFLRETEKIDVADVIETLGSKRPFKGSIAGMAKTAEGLENTLNKTYDDVIAANQGKMINVRGSLGTAKNKFDDEFINQAKHADVIEGLERGAKEWTDKLSRINTQSGWLPLEKAKNFRVSAGRAGKYNVNKDPKELEGVAQFARELYSNLTNQESRLVPELKPVKESLSKLYPLREAVENAQGRTANNFYPGLTDNIALAAAAQAQKPEMSIPGLLLFLANRTVKNPAAATATYQAGKALETPGAGQQALRMALKRALSQSFREDE